MTSRRWSPFPAAVVAVVTLLVSSMWLTPARARARPVAAPATSVAADSSWSAAFNQTGTDNDVYCSLESPDGDTLIIGGRFRVVGPDSIASVAATDGVNWWSYGAGLPDSVLALCWWNGQLVAGGAFKTSEGGPANYLATWNGTTWQPWPQPVNHRVDALTVYQGQLIVGGFFTAAGGVTLNRIGAWDGTQWHAMGLGVALNTPEVFAFQEWNGTLYVGGRFQQAGGLAVGNFAQWDGTAWGVPAISLDTSVERFTIWNDLLILAGPFSIVNGQEVEKGIVGYDGARTASFAGGLGNAAEALAVLHGKLIATGGFNSAGGVYALGAAAWDGVKWNAMTSGLQLSPVDHGWSAPMAVVFQNRCIIGGWFLGGGGVWSPNLVAWNDTTWQTFTPGLGASSDAIALCQYHGSLIVGGSFYTVGPSAENSIAAWNGAAWGPVGTGVNNYPIEGMVVFGDSLIVGGNFSAAGGVAAKNIACWDGTAWHALGTGFNAAVYSVAVWNGHVVAGGAFTKSGTRSTSHLAVWSGTTWLPLGSGVDGEVWSLGTYNGSLVVGGRFQNAGGQPASSIALYNGSVWNTLAGGVTLSTGTQAWAQSQIVWNGQLIVGGTFSAAGGVAANYLAAWDGAGWTQVGGGGEWPERAGQRTHGG